MSHRQAKLFPELTQTNAALPSNKFIAASPRELKHLCEPGIGQYDNLRSPHHYNPQISPP